MIWFVIGAAVAIVVIIRCCVDDWFEFWEKCFCSFVALLLAVIISFLVWFLASFIISASVDMKYVKESDTQIIALKDNQNISGSFYIMGGYVDEDLYYYYATETENGYKTEKIAADEAYIKYTDEKPHIETYAPEFPKDILYGFGNPLARKRYVIYCPENTITTEFAIDLE